MSYPLVGSFSLVLMKNFVKALSRKDKGYAFLHQKLKKKAPKNLYLMILKLENSSRTLVLIMVGCSKLKKFLVSEGSYWANNKFLLICCVNVRKNAVTLVTSRLFFGKLWRPGKNKVNVFTKILMLWRNAIKTNGMSISDQLLLVLEEGCKDLSAQTGAP